MRMRASTCVFGSNLQQMTTTFGFAVSLCCILLLRYKLFEIVPSSPLLPLSLSPCCRAKPFHCYRAEYLMGHPNMMSTTFRDVLTISSSVCKKVCQQIWSIPNFCADIIFESPPADLLEFLRGIIRPSRLVEKSCGPVTTHVSI